MTHLVNAAADVWLKNDLEREPLSAKTFSFILTVFSTLALVLAVGFYLFFFRIRLVPSASMHPTLEVGETVFCLTIHSSKDISRGDIVVFSPYTSQNNYLNVAKENRTDVYVKRVIGLPGERISISGNVLYIDGEPFDEPYLTPGTPLLDYEEILVPAGCYFMMGDNRMNSFDSRDYGCIPFENMQSKELFHFDSLPLMLKKLGF